MSLATLSAIKLNLGIADSDTSQDSRLTAWMNAAIAAVQRACEGVDFESITRTEYYEPDGWNLITRHRPISSITTVYEDANAAWGDESGAFAADTILVAGSDYALVRDGSGVNGEVAKSGIIRRIGTKWATAISPVAYRNTNYNNLTRSIVPAIGPVKLVYVSGYTTCPVDVTQAICAEVDMMRAMAGQGGQQMTSESLGEYSYSTANLHRGVQDFGYFLSPQAAVLMQPYMASRIAL